MGVERNDTDPSQSRAVAGRGSDPSHAPQDGRAAAHGTSGQNGSSEQPGLVDFDALHAALGVGENAANAPNAHAAVRPREPSVGASEVLDEIAAEIAPRVGESSGRTNAHYASSRPHTIPPTRAPVEDPNVPAVIVDEVPVTEDLQTTTPIAAPMARRAASSGAMPVSLSVTAQMPAAPPPPVQPQASQPITPPQFSAPAVPPGAMKHTVPMVNRPRRPRAQTIVVRRRGPSARQKLVAFVAMLMLVTCCGIAVIVWRKPSWIGLSAGSTPTTQAVTSPVVAQSPSGTNLVTSLGTNAGATSTASASPPSTSSVASASSAKKTPKAPPTAHPTSH